MKTIQTTPLKQVNCYQWMLLGILFSFAIQAKAQKASSSDMRDSVEYTWALLKDGTTVSGKMISASASQIRLMDFQLGEVTINRSQIKSETRVRKGGFYCFTLESGREYCGEVLAVDSLIYIKTESIDRMQIIPAKVKSVSSPSKQMASGKNKKGWFENPHPTRYFFVPSAIPLKKGIGYYQNVGLLGNFVHYGITDHISMGGGCVFPFLYMITSKVGYQVGPNTHVALGGVYSDSFLGFGLGAAFGAITFGDLDRNITLNTGYGFVKEKNYSNFNAYNYEWNSTDKPMFTISGMYRLAENASLITENWFFSRNTGQGVNQTSAYDGVFSLGFRFMTKRNSFDTGLMSITTNNNGNRNLFPYIDYTYRFGKQ
jgi:hypothetical protein